MLVELLAADLVEERMTDESGVHALAAEPFDLEGQAGLVGALAVHSAPPLQAEGARVAGREGRRTRLTVPFPPGEGFTTSRVLLRP